MARFRLQIVSARFSGETFRAAGLLQTDEHFAGRLRFNPGDLLIRINDRLQAPNSAATYQQLMPQIQAAVKDLPGPATLTPTKNPLSVFEVSVQTAMAVELPVAL